MAQIVQPKLYIEKQMDWAVAQILLEHLMHAEEPPTFTMRRLDDGNVVMWFSKRTHDWLRSVLELDPRSH